LQNCLLILICKILKYRRIFFAKKYRNFEDKKIDNTIKRYIAIKIWIKYRLSLNIIYIQDKVAKLRKYKTILNLYYV